MSEYHDEFQEDQQKLNALNLSWTLGFNYKMVNGVHNLTNDSRKEIFYATAHTGVIFDYGNNQQRLLQGHCNKISCTAYCKELDIIVTADAGPDSMLVIWDAKTGVPRRTIFEPHANGVQAVDISENGQYLVTLSKEEPDKIQSISFWDWQSQDPRLRTTVLDDKLKDYQYYVTINNNAEQKQNQQQIFEFATTGKKRVVFWSWEYGAAGFEYYSPEVQKNKVLTQTVFIPKNKNVVTGTLDGYIIVWDVSLIIEEYGQPDERRVIKIVNLMNVANKSETQQKKGNAQILLLRVQGRYLVVGASNGSIRFYDFKFRIRAWFEDVVIGQNGLNIQCIGSITNLSFANESVFQEDFETESDEEKDKDEQSQKKSKPFLCQDFIVVDDRANVILLKSSQFQEIEKEKKKGTVIMSSIVSPIISISVRPNVPVVAFSCEDNKIYEWNFYEKHNKLKEIKEKGSELQIQILMVIIQLSVQKMEQFICMIAEKKNGLKIYWFQKLTKLNQKQPIQLLVLIQNILLRLMNLMQSVFLIFDFDPNSQLKQQKEWIFAGKYRVHHGPIKSVAFGETLDEKNQVQLKVFTIGEDMKLAVYDVLDPTQDPYNRVKLRSVVTIEQECLPSACIWYPINLQREDVLLTTNSEFKLKLWTVLKDLRIICKKTCLGPTFGGHIKRLLLLNPSDMKNEYQDKYLAYSTGEKVVGIIKLPLDGNPNKTMGLIAHPEKIVDLSSTQDGKLFFTSGGDDFAINIWSVDFAALEDNFQTQETEYEIFSNLLDGGPEGQTLRDLKDFFYYSQIRSKDEHTTKARKLDGLVPLTAIADMMRSMGYFPTNQEIENMINEIKFSKYLETGEQISELEINTFLKLYVNHKPVNGVTKGQIYDALKTLATDTGVIPWDQFTELLKTKGEKLDEQEIEYYLESLLPNKNYPQQLNLNNLCDELLGFEDMDGTQEQQEQQEEVQDVGSEDEQQ
ncbi:unnamed protein product (macronuclear) [Paramecium tetraurelia]|uniref:Cilia- and flagella-associated protein 251 n=1 Tax=Paramecium tetraurelia TaxID=5888 RepID=A0E5I3_PARTE|nr:uncharacterized protein GSPATT00003411001 [Paramecium tetraurelia]CAK90550.1 unnamed protein product [Paramecium tetraurelia]|eukprot:XP_001457947.1 hypothetical protein (macronuclear) [Paramecium tetraurelia strain d4-2]